MFDFADIDFAAPAAPAQAPSGPCLPDAMDCLRCGMCVGVCPTYKLFQDEAETPRGRVRTLARLLVEDQPVTAVEHAHLENCLQCRACERVCPSRMAYGRLYDQALAQNPPQYRWPAGLALRLIENRRWRLMLLPLLALYKKSGLSPLLRGTGLLRRLGLAAAESLLTAPALRPLAACYPVAAPRGRVALFTGCVAEHFDRATHLAAISLLNAIGYDVLVPGTQVCCGAIHLHNGRPATGFVEDNIRAFNALPVQAVLHVASGCGAMLSEYQAADNDQAGLFRQRLADAQDFLLAHWPDDLQLLPATQRVAVHEPCSQRNVLQNTQSVYSLLAKIPGTVAEPLADNQFCCGAGGSYMLSHPQNAAGLRELKLQAMATAGADRVATGNYACAAHLASAAHKLVHPLVLLAGQLPAHIRR